MGEKLIWVATAVVVALSLYGIWLITPEKFPLALVGFLIVAIFSLVFAIEDSQEERRQKECAVRERTS